MRSKVPSVEQAGIADLAISVHLTDCGSIARKGGETQHDLIRGHNEEQRLKSANDEP
jgi:hypothetical protein